MLEGFRSNKPFDAGSGPEVCLSLDLGFFPPPPPQDATMISVVFRTQSPMQRTLCPDPICRKTLNLSSLTCTTRGFQWRCRWASLQPMSADGPIKTHYYHIFPHASPRGSFQDSVVTWAGLVCFLPPQGYAQGLSCQSQNENEREVLSGKEGSLMLAPKTEHEPSQVQYLEDINCWKIDE